MSSVFSNLLEHENLSPVERQLAVYVTEHLDEIPKLSSRELARRTFTSSTAIIRFVRKLGFENYNDFRVNLASYLKSLPLEDIRINGDEDYLLVLNKLTELEVDTINVIWLPKFRHV